MEWTLCISIFFFVTAVLSGAQQRTDTDIQAKPRFEFEVASVKAVEYTGRPGFAGTMRGGPGTDSPGSIVYSSVTLATVLSAAYGVKRDQMEGPAWLDGNRYEIAARIPPGTSEQQFKLMLQNLILDRFKLKFHRDTRSLPVYVLVVAKGGSKLQSSEGSGEARCVASVGSIQPGEAPRPAVAANAINHRECANMTMDQFVVTLSQLAPRYIDRPVLNQTDLKGTYNFKLEWTTLQSSGGDTSSPTGNMGGYTLFEALEKELGLKLNDRKAPMESIIIDQVEPKPTAN
jgi:uncharacterized protein (TIGR03435 family)